MKHPHNDQTLPFWHTRYGIATAIPTDNPVARSLQLYGEWAEHETALLSGLIEEGQTILEFGGDFAAHALWMAQAVGPLGEVHVAEPRRIRFQQVCANIAINGLDNVFTHPVWLGRGKGHSSLGSLLAGSRTGAEEKVRMATVDSLRLEALHLLKVNQPHALVEILAGAAETIRTHRPLLYVRLSGIDEAEKEIAAIKALGYRAWSHLPYLFNPDNHAGVDANIFPGMVQQNVIAAPADSRFEFAERLEL
jgi:FkbM family methyltransferase